MTKKPKGNKIENIALIAIVVTLVALSLFFFIYYFIIQT